MCEIRDDGGCCCYVRTTILRPLPLPLLAASASTALENPRCGAGVVVDDVLNSSVFGGHQHLRALEVCK